MEAFKNLPIGRKLTLIITLTSGAVIALVSTLIIGYQVKTSQAFAVDELYSVGEVITASISRLHMAEDVAREYRELHSLQTNPDILTARIFDKGGRLLANYVKAGSDASEVEFGPMGERHWVDGQHLVLSHRILAEGEPVGTLVLVSDWSRQRSRLRDSILVVAFLMLAAVCVLVLLADRLQEVVTRPIRNLSMVAQAVAQEKNYSLRAVQESCDETGVLVGAINQMLGQIQRHDEELRASQQQFREAEEKYRLLVERVPAVTYVAELGAGARWSYVSPQIEPLLGFSPQEWMDDSGLWFRQIHPDDQARALLHEEQARESGKYDAEYRMKTRDGRVVWVRDVGVALLTTGGSPPQLHGILYDITRRKLAEAALRESEQRLQSIMDNSTAVIYLKAADGRYLLINRLYESLFHVSRAAVIGKTDYDIFPRTTADEFRKNDQRVLREKAPVRFEEVAPHDDGLHTYLSLKFPFLDESNEPYAVCGISTDITDRKQAEQALQLQARVLENMVEGVFVYDDNQRILLTNSAMDAMFGYAPGELVGQSTFVLTALPPEKCSQIAEEIRHRLQTDKSVERLFLNRRRDGSEFISESRICRLQFTGAWCFVAVVQDVTERQRLEMQILEVSDREQRRIGQDLHDGLCQLLTGTHFAIRALEQKLSNDGISVAAEASEIADLLRRANGEARSIARGLHPPEIEAGGLTAALQELAFRVTSLFPVACHFHCNPDVKVEDNAKAVHIYRITQEAVNNALKHGEANQISIVFTRSSASTATLTIGDNGVGLPTQVSASNGMGLKIMAYRAKMVGGTLQVGRGTDGGTMVTLEFPI